VVTIGGIHGAVVALDDTAHTVTLRVADNVKITFNRTAIAGLVQIKE
jgi:preprotein translocase YajC subunit